MSTHPINKATVLVNALRLYKDATEKCIKDYLPHPGHRSDVVELEAELLIINEMLKENSVNQ